MEAVDLLRGDAPFVADTSAWWRALALPSELGSMLQQAIRDDRLWITPIVRMEILYSARTSAEHLALKAELDALRILRNDRAVANTVMSALSELAARSDDHHRTPPADALIAAAAAEHTAVSPYSTATRTSTASQRCSTSRASRSRDRRQAPAQPRQSGSTNSAARQPAARPRQDAGRVRSGLLLWRVACPR